MIGRTQRDAQAEVLAVADFDEPLTVWQSAEPQNRKAAAEERMGRVGDLDDVEVDESGRIDRGINFGRLAPSG